MCLYVQKLPVSRVNDLRWAKDIASPAPIFNVSSRPLHCLPPAPHILRLGDALRRRLEYWASHSDVTSCNVALTRLGRTHFITEGETASNGVSVVSSFLTTRDAERRVPTRSVIKFESKAEPQCKLDLAGRRGGHRNDAELRRVDKAFWGIKVGVIKNIKELGAKLELAGLAE